MMNRKDKDRYGLLRKLNKGERFPLVVSQDFYHEVDRLLKRAFKSSLRSKFRGLDDATMEAFFSEALQALWQVQVVKGHTHLDSHPSTFMFGVGYNLACKMAQRSSRHRCFDEGVLERLGQMDSDPLAFELRFSGQLAIVHEVLAEQRDKDRQLIELYHFKRHCMEELAPMLGYSSVNSVKKAKCLALGKIREQALRRWSDVDMWGNIAA